MSREDYSSTPGGWVDPRPARTVAIAYFFAFVAVMALGLIVTACDSVSNQSELKVKLAVAQVEYNKMKGSYSAPFNEAKRGDVIRVNDAFGKTEETVIVLGWNHGYLVVQNLWRVLRPDPLTTSVDQKVWRPEDPRLKSAELLPRPGSGDQVLSEAVGTLIPPLL